MRKKLLCMILTILMLLQLTACGKKSELDDYATNVGYENQNSSASTEATSKKIAKEDIKIGVIHLSDPAEGSGYSYTHDLGIQGMQENLGLSDSQIIRRSMLMIQAKKTPTKQFRTASMKVVISYLQQAGDTWTLQKNLPKSTLTFISVMEQATKAMARILQTTSVEFTRQDI